MSYLSSLTSVPDYVVVNSGLPFPKSFCIALQHLQEAPGAGKPLLL